MKIKTYTPNKASPNGHLTAMVSDYDLEEEQKKRQGKKSFPLHIFPPEIQPLLSAMYHQMEAEKSFIGLTVLCVAGAAIGSSLRAKLSKTMEVPLTTWGAVVGTSSSGKSMVQGLLMKPLNDKQREFTSKYFEEMEKFNNGEKGGESNGDPSCFEPQRKVVVVSDITLEALTRDVMRNNFKGILKYHDELLTWLDGMDRKKGDTTEQTFWTEAWNPKMDYMQQRVGNKLFVVKRENMFASVLGATQPGVLHRFFEKGKREQGFTYRILFAHADTNKMIAPSATYELPDGVLETYCWMINTLYDELYMSKTSEPGIAMFDHESRRMYDEWQNKYKDKINKVVHDNPEEHEIRAGFFCKAREYALRFALILKAMHRAFDEGGNIWIRKIESKWMEYGIEAAEYFYEAGWEAYCLYKRRDTIPIEVLEFAAKLKAVGYKQAELARQEGCTPANINKKYKRYVAEYPTAFSAKNQ